MTYNVFGGTLNPAQPQPCWLARHWQLYSYCCEWRQCTNFHQVAHLTGIYDLPVWMMLCMWKLWWICTEQSTGSPQTPSRKSVRLLAKQLHEEELKNTMTPQRSEELKHSASPVHPVVTTPSQMSVRSHFIDSRQLRAADSATDVTVRSPTRKTPLRSPSRQDVSGTVRRSPRLMAKQDNLLLTSPASSASSVRLVSCCYA